MTQQTTTEKARGKDDAVGERIAKDFSDNKCHLTDAEQRCLAGTIESAIAAVAAERDELRARMITAIRYARLQKEVYCKVDALIMSRDNALTEMERYGDCIADVLGAFGKGECPYLDEARKQTGAA